MFYFKKEPELEVDPESELEDEIEEPELEEDDFEMKKPAARRSHLEEAMSNLSLSARKGSQAARGAEAKPYGVMHSYPFIIYTFFRGGRLRARVDFLVHPMKQDSFLPKVLPDGKSLSLTTKLPHIFHDAERVKLAKVGIDRMFSDDNHEHTAFTEVADQLHAEMGLEDMDDEEISSPPVLVELPFVCEEEIVDWEVLFLPNNDGPDGFPPHVSFFHAILSVELVSVEKKTQKKKGSARMIGAASPPPTVKNEATKPPPPTTPHSSMSKKKKNPSLFNPSLSAVKSNQNHQQGNHEEEFANLNFPVLPPYEEETTQNTTSDY